MQKKFKDKIKQHFPVLVDSIDPEALTKHLLSKKALKKGEVNKILADRRDNKHTNRLLLFQILKKNDNIYQEFVRGLELFNLKHLFSPNQRPHTTVFHQANQVTPEEELSDFSNLNLHNPVERSNTVEKPYHGKRLEVKVKLANNFQETDFDNVYNTKSPKRGQVLIINNVHFDKHSERKGSEIDVECLESLFKQMFFNVKICRELSTIEMEKEIQKFADYDSDKISDICVVIIMSHGEERKKELYVLDKANNGLRTSWIEEQFSNVNCALFAGRPKIILYQICRGNQDDCAIASSREIEMDPPQVLTQHDHGEDSVQTDSGGICIVQRRLEDMLVGHATQKGHTAHRDPSSGSWYIQLICEVFMEKAHKTHIVDMLNEVDRKMRTRSSLQYTMQTSSYESNGFNKLMYFNPGIYLDNDGNVQRFTS